VASTYQRRVVSGKVLHTTQQQNERRNAPEDTLRSGNVMP
jgi:hypothetical protein